MLILFNWILLLLNNFILFFHIISKKVDFILIFFNFFIIFKFFLNLVVFHFLNLQLWNLNFVLCFKITFYYHISIYLKESFLFWNLIFLSFTFDFQYFDQTLRYFVVLILLRKVRKTFILTFKILIFTFILKFIKCLYFWN